MSASGKGPALLEKSLAQGVNDPGAATSKGSEIKKHPYPEHDKHREKQWVKLAQNGDHAAFEALFMEYRGRAYSVALGVLKHPDDAMDVVQEAFVKAYRNLGRFEGNSSFYTWFYRIVMNLAIDHTRKNRRVVKSSFDEQIAHSQEHLPEGAVAVVPHVSDGNPGGNADRKELRAQIQAALEQLSEDHRAVILLREIEGMSYEDIAESLEIPKGTVMSRLFHARKKLQSALAGYLGERES